MKKYFIFATALAALASCSSDDFVGESPNGVNSQVNDAINFSSGFKTVTRATTGADAADLLGEKFIVGGYKGGDATDGVAASSGVSSVFDNYIVNWKENTAGTTESNTSNWEYVGIEIAAPSSLYTDVSTDPGYQAKQTIKYWDYSASQYDFIAYSVGEGNTLVAKTSSDIATGELTDNNVWVTAINAATAKTDAYKLRGKKADLLECYIANLKTVTSDDYKNVVQLEFRSLAAKIRIALYETIPGYSVKQVEFYNADNTPIKEGDNYVAPTGTATLIGTFQGGGVYTVSYPTIGSSNSTETDYNKAHVTLSNAETAATTQTFGSVNYTTKERKEATAAGTAYLARSSAAPSYAGSGSDYYQNVLPDESGNMLELRVNYTLVPIDGASETIVVRGAKAFIPAAYTQWNANYAYTYIFKISDNTNGYTSDLTTNPVGLYPITFDAVVADTQSGSMETITTVSTPSITSYQKGSNVTTDNEYSASGKPIYLVVEDGTGVKTLTVGTIAVTNATSNAWLYEATVESGAVQGITEMSVDNAIANGVYNATEHSYTVTDVNDKKLVVKTNGVATLTPSTEIDASDSPTGVAITINGAKFTPAAGKTYVFQYLVTAPVYDSGTVLETSTSLKGYYTDSEGTKTRCDDAATADGSTTYYKVTTPGVYQYKVIKIKSGS